MAIMATGQISIVDLSDGKALSAYITSNLPKTQVVDPNPGGTTSPDWTVGAKLILTPVVFLNQTAVALNALGLTVTWKRKEGSGSETAVTTGETVTSNILTVSQNKLTGVASGLLTYIIYVTYVDPDTGETINVTTDITYAQIKTAMNAKVAWIGGEQAFKYDLVGAVTPTQITLTANTQVVTISKWQYKNGSGVWTDYPTTADNTNITSETLNIKPAHTVFVNDAATLRIVTSDANITDTFTIYKVRDGATGATGLDAYTVILSNEAMAFAGNVSGQLGAQTKTCNVIAYKGATKVTPTVGTVTGAPTGMSVSAGAASNNEIPLTITISTNTTLGGAGNLNGTLTVPVTVDGKSFTKLIEWSKINTGATGATGSAGVDAVVFSLYAPNGNVFINQGGSLLIATSKYKGITEITTGATYVWKELVTGSWTTIAGQTSDSLTVAGSDVVGVGSYQCTMTYQTKVYTDTITLIDKTDNYQCAIESTGGDKFKNTVGESILIARLFQNGVEVDALKTSHISDTAPGSPISGTFWYKVTKGATPATRTVVLQKYNGSTWADAAGGDLHTKIYNWYRLDKDGNALDTSTPFKIGKVIFINGDDVATKTTYKCEVE